MPRSTTPSAGRGKKSGPLTRGGWTPVGTAAERRANHASKGTARGERTRRGLLDAARRVFENIGYIDAGVEDIVKEAGVARGSFYTYFEDKLEVFRILSAEVNQAVLEAATAEPTKSLGPIARLHESNLRYIATYEQHAAMYGLVEQVATIDPEVHTDRTRRRRDHVARVADTIRRWQHRGIADTTIDAETTAGLLVSMTSNFNYWWFVGNESHDHDEAATALTDAWVRTIGLSRDKG
ncbi:TetR/AcrR family transcriptional regulator [Rhodococcus sp. Leaf258]|uniref:TetR/AcrR family transcriptional regulator n=1 Tax=Rhodococcus sp. Leaf258 TaxID=1736310 RepID=UPI000B1DEE16|nr:TetR/AcrR family transcriptional regulator [Rhodococcus sp. Leaf258]